MDLITLRSASLPLAPALALALAALAGCASDPPPPAPVAAPVPVAAAPAPAVQPAAPQAAMPAAQSRALPPSGAQSTVATVTVHPLDDPKSPLAARKVHFDFDSALIRDTERSLIDSHAKYLALSRSARVRIEGHCDERGGREYNLALGQRRAEAVRKSLLLLGVPEVELDAISYGKERPLDAGHDEAAWARNRRADLNYLAR